MVFSIQAKESDRSSLFSALPILASSSLATTKWAFACSFSWRPTRLSSRWHSFSWASFLEGTICSLLPSYFLWLRLPTLFHVMSPHSLPGTSVQSVIVRQRKGWFLDAIIHYSAKTRSARCFVPYWHQAHWSHFLPVLSSSRLWSAPFLYLLHQQPVKTAHIQASSGTRLLSSIVNFCLWPGTGLCVE